MTKTILKEEDFYLNSEGEMVFTEIYHRKRGFCCKSGCCHCPFGFGSSVDPNTPTEFLCAKEDEPGSLEQLQDIASQYEDQF